MTSHSRFTLEEARAAGERIGVDWGSSPFDLGQFRMGMDIELEHGTRDPETNVTDDDVTMTAKIARAHLNEFPDYYTRLAKMEAEAEARWRRTGPRRASERADIAAIEPRRRSRGQQRFARQLCDVMWALAPALMLDTSRTLPGPMSVSCQSGRRPAGWCRDRCGEAGVKDVR